MKNTDGRTSRPEPETLAHLNRVSEQFRPSVGARGFEPLIPSEDPQRVSKHEPEDGTDPSVSELLSLEDRLYVALAHRGPLSIAQFIVRATGATQPFKVKDADLVALCEDYAASLSE